MRVTGIVQGVGMRPTVYRLAKQLGLRGDVRNSSAGLLVRICASAAQRDAFIEMLIHQAPPLSRIDHIERQAIADSLPAGFQILASDSGTMRTHISPDAAHCAHCLRDITRRDNRRAAYAFTNCTHCGPRLSIIRAIPYDRANTSMAAFAMCGACRKEYEDPTNRRFHAQPNACPDCGPRLWLEPSAKTDADPIAAAINLLKRGNIVAIKGIGGIHLACDASNEKAVARLRERKHRPHKPLALMARDEAMIRRYCSLSQPETDLLHSVAAPIILLAANGGETLASGVAPGQSHYGVMLPYSPLHYLLMANLDHPIVLTSGNRSEEPQCIANAEARRRLSGIADALLLHDRDIVNRLDDSVVRRVDGQTTLLRRARGYAPAPLPLPPGFADAPPILALGGELKNTICLLRSGDAIMSQHLGDLENAKAHAAYRDTLDLYLQLFEHTPEILVVDKHPEYLSTKLGHEWAQTRNLKIEEVQHHHAHVAACMADNGLAVDSAPVLGIALDGTGYGDDAQIWGGEFLLADYRWSRRIGSIEPVPLAGGAQAIREPWRITYAWLRQCLEWPEVTERYADLAFIRGLSDKPLTTLSRMMDAGLNSPMTSACGRLFDAAAALAGVRQTVTYEGQAAMEFESLVDSQTMARGEAYPFELASANDTGVALIKTRTLWQAMLEDLGRGDTVGAIAARFHNGLAQAIVAMATSLTAAYPEYQRRVALSGGVFQNATLLTAVRRQLRSAGFTVYTHSGVPCNDGGLSLGQAVIAAARYIDRP